MYDWVTFATEQKLAHHCKSTIIKTKKNQFITYRWPSISMVLHLWIQPTKICVLL